MTLRIALAYPAKIEALIGPSSLFNPNFSISETKHAKKVRISSIAR